MGRLRSLLALLGAHWLPARYMLLLCSWAMYFWFLYSEPVLRLPLALYVLYIFSPPGQRAVDHYRGPTFL